MKIICKILKHKVLQTEKKDKQSTKHSSIVSKILMENLCVCVYVWIYIYELFKCVY